MTKETKQWWEATSQYYQKDSDIPIGIHYGPGAPFEDGKYGLHLLGNLRGKRVLELGCGGAQCGIAMAKQGAKVIGVDISEEQLKFAKALAEKNHVGVNFYRGDIKRFPYIPSKSQDLVFTAWALLYVDDLGSCFKEAYRVLKNDGRFVLAMPHPFFNTINPKTLKLRQGYLGAGKWENVETWEDGSKHKFVMYNRTVSEIANHLTDSGFNIEKIVEPDSRIHYKRDPWYNLWEFKPKIMKYVPPTIIFKAKNKKCPLLNDNLSLSYNWNCCSRHPQTLNQLLVHSIAL